MATSGQKRTRSERVAALELSPGQWERAWESLQRRDVLLRIGLAFLAAVVIGIVIRAWNPPFAFRTGYTPPRDVVARASFSKEDVEATKAAQRRAREQVSYVYVHDPQPLVQLRFELRNSVIDRVARAETLVDLGKELWEQLRPPRSDDEPEPTAEEDEEAFQRLRAAFSGQENLERLEKAIADAFAPFEQRGILLSSAVEQGKGNQEEIRVHPRGRAEPLKTVKISDVLIGDGTALKESLAAQFQQAQKELPPFDHAEVAERLFAWIKPRLAQAATLTIDETVDITTARNEAAAEVEPVMVPYEAGKVLVEAPRPEKGAAASAGETKRTPALDEADIALLRLEYEALLAERTWTQKLARGTAVIVMVFAMFVLCGIYMRYRQRGPLASLRRLSGILLLAVLAVAVSRWFAADQWRVEIIPVMLFGMIIAMVYQQELAMLFSAVLSLILVLAIGNGLHGFLLLMGVSTAANLNMGRIRTRSKLIYVGLFAAATAVLLDVAMSIVDDQPFGLALLKDAARSGLLAVMAGFLMAGLLPFIEKLFGVLTDLSLLELGDVAHPLLQELVRRAPSTYNHSVTVGSIAEAAADRIGARGLLVRVGAYFHDIGKMLKPGYYIENQGPEGNRHETLVPAMSSLVIVAHIKDGADLARQHHLPQAIVDLIEQHHGTTRVGFFYERATQQQQADPNGGEVEESTYRYPGPKPQTKEAAVLMLADSVESASRTLVDPTPKRIESLVRDVAEHRLHGGQFDESGLTLRELRTIEKSLAMSLTSIYHGRIKYPDQKTA